MTGLTLKGWEVFQRPLAVLLMAPAILIALPFTILVQIRSPGPLLHASVREGRGGAEFKLLKLRTMIPNAEYNLISLLEKADGAEEHWRRYGFVTNDPRIAGPAAQIARRFSIDELPQLLNVAKGEMNLIGPRPMPTVMVNCMSPADRAARRTLKPGMTGLWQVSGRSNLPIKMMGRLDHRYVNRRSVALDIGILIRTFGVVIKGDGAY